MKQEGGGARQASGAGDALQVGMLGDWGDPGRGVGWAHHQKMAGVLGPNSRDDTRGGCGGQAAGMEFLVVQTRAKKPRRWGGGWALAVGGSVPCRGDRSLGKGRAEWGGGGG